MSRQLLHTIALSLVLTLGLSACGARGDKDKAAEEETMPGTVFRKDAVLSVTSPDNILRGEFDVEIAATTNAVTQGLMYRESMEPNRGMLFDPKAYSKNPFWMKNTYIPLDIVFIDADRKIMHIATNTTPFSEDRIDPQGTYRYVLELNAGVTQKLNIAIGDIITWTKSN